MKRIAVPLAALAKRTARPNRRQIRRARKRQPRPHRSGCPQDRAAREAHPARLDRHAERCAGTGERPEEFVDWFEIEREDGRDFDVGLWRHWIDPTIPLRGRSAGAAHGALITSATLRDAESGGDDWQSAESAHGRGASAEPARRAASARRSIMPSRRASSSCATSSAAIRPQAAAYRELFLAAGGGALGLFTACARCAQCKNASRPLADAGLTLYAQHVDRLDTGALVDLFRAEENACLLGTDAVRDGVDVPGRSLRLVVFDKRAVAQAHDPPQSAPRALRKIL
jgi:ATP-dependent DNA helicase DinG